MNEQRGSRGPSPNSPPFYRDPRPTLICFSHLRWSFVFQRPQHLMTRFAASHRVLFWEETIFVEGIGTPRLREEVCQESGVIVLTPELPPSLRGREDAALAALLDAVLAKHSGALIRWYYTPMMLPFSDHLDADCIVYDCMDELSAFRGAPPELLEREQMLLERADIVFTGGTSLFEAKRERHANVHVFPSSIDVSHFSRAIGEATVPVDQALIDRPLLGFCGVIDERMDLGLLAAVADAHPEWSVVVLGPVVKIAESDLPRRTNIHYLGSKPYAQLPDYMAGWDVALMPFAQNEATRFISPTKTPEYLAAGLPVVSTPIVDVVRHYGSFAAVAIADTPDAFVSACERQMTLAQTDPRWREPVDAMLARSSWSSTVLEMSALIAAEIAGRGKLEVIVSPTTSRPRHERYDVMVVGAGFAGAVMAQRLAEESGKRVLVVDRRPHVAGNAFDRIDEAGLLIHQYGPHIFHTNSAGGLRLSLAFYRMAAVRTPRARQRGRSVGADADQSHDAERALRCEAGERRRRRGIPRRAR